MGRNSYGVSKSSWKKMKLADLVYTCHFSQVSKADLDAFENWLGEVDDSCLEFQTVGGPLVQIKRQMISGMQKSLELIPRGKGVSTERLSPFAEKTAIKFILSKGGHSNAP